MSDYPHHLYLSTEETEKLRLEDEAERLAQAEEALAHIEEKWPEALEQSEAAPADAPHSMRLGAVEALVNAREHVLRQLGGDPEKVATPKAARNAKRHPSGEVADKLHRRGEHLQELVKSTLAKRKAAHAKKLKP